MLREIQPTVQCGQKGRRLPKKEREWIVVEVEVEKVELLVVTFLSDTLQHHHVKCIGVSDGSIKAQCSRPCCIKFRGGPGVAACKKCHIVSECDEFLRQPVYHPLGSTIQFRRNSLRQRSYLRDAHLLVSS